MTNEPRRVDLNLPDDKEKSDIFLDVRMTNSIAGLPYIVGNQYTTEGAILQHQMEVSRKVRDGNLDDLEDMLTSQALLLNNVFGDMMKRSAENCENYFKASTIFMNMGLKAQAQCRCTVEAINEIKNPKSVTITRQANVAGQQVVNNGVMNTGSVTGAENNQNESNELLAEVQHETVDTGATASTKGADTEAKTVVEVNRSKNSKRKG